MPVEALHVVVTLFAGGFEVKSSGLLLSTGSPAHFQAFERVLSDRFVLSGVTCLW